MATSYPAPGPRTGASSALLLLVAAVGLCGAAGLLKEERQGVVYLAAVVCGGLGVAVFVAGLRSSRRAELLSRLAFRLGSSVGIRPSDPGFGLRAHAWSLWGWPGSPKRLRVTYVPGGRVKTADFTFEVGDDRWARELARSVSDFVGGHYVVAKHRPHRGWVQLRATAPDAEREKAEQSPQAARATKLMGDLLGPTARVENVATDEAGEVTELEVRHEAGAKLVAPGYRTRVERTVSAMLVGRWRAHWDMVGDSVRFEVRPTLPDSVWIPPLETPETDPLLNYDAVEIPYGIDEDGEVMVWKPAISPQLILTGGTGSGKTSTTHAIAVRLTQYGWPVWVADGKAVEFLGFQDWPNVQIVATTIQEQVAVIHRAWQLMEHRYQLVVQRKARTEDFEPVVVFVDEFSDLKGNLLAWYTGIKQKGDPAKPTTLMEVGSIARKGRTARIHLVVALQRPDAEILTGEARDNFTQRISVGRLSPEGATMMWGNPVTGVTLPLGRRGRAIGVSRAGAPVEMQCYRTPDPAKAAPGTEEWDLVQQLRPAEARQDRLVIIPPEIDWSGDDPVEPRFDDYTNAEWGRAEDHPELDPLAHADGPSRGIGEGRRLSSPMAMLGLLADQDGGTSTAALPTPVPAQPEPVVDELEEQFDDQYGHQLPVPAGSVQVGDLICVDADLDAWAVVEEEPMPDFENDDLLLIAWRDDQDASGQLAVPADSRLSVRRPTGGM